MTSAEGKPALSVIRRAWRAFWQPWRIAFTLGAITGMSTMYASDHPDTPMRSVVGMLVAVGVLPWIAMLISPRIGPCKEDRHDRE